MTQQDLANKLNVSRKTISGWENSKAYPDITTLLIISDLFNISINDLFNEDLNLFDHYIEADDEKKEKYFCKSYFILSQYNHSYFCILKFVESL